MYIPTANEETRVPVIHQLMRAEPLASLVTMSRVGCLRRTLLVLDNDGTEFGVLRGHVSRANEQWKYRDPSVEALAIFAVPQQYISPSWYPGKLEHGKEVPTWNYAVVHAYGAKPTARCHGG